jgi:hypothetical protein
LGCTTDQIAQWDDGQSRWVCASLPDIATLQTQVSDLAGKVTALQDLLQPLSRTGNTLLISGANLQIVNGAGATDSAPNGLGNLIIGYNEVRVASADDPNPVNARTGSHMLIVGKEQNYTSFGGIVAGAYNSTAGPFASVSGGTQNSADGEYAAVGGGHYNQATGAVAVVSGGEANKASGLAAAVSGGSNNEASQYGATVSGGALNKAVARYATVSGGSRQVADGIEEHVP